MMILICAETMLFAGFVGAYLVFRLKAHEWPPVNQPRLPVPITVVNTLVLFASAWPLTRALRAVRRPHAPELSRLLWITTALGVVFLAVQGREWVGLVAHGLTLGSSVYGGTFYLLIGCHGIHVLTAVGWLVVVAARASRGAFSPARFAGVEMCAMYWYFVCGLWAGLFPLVYLY
jgi:cytochrome c oxidase subunit 3